MAEQKFVEQQKNDIAAEILDAIQCKVCERDLSETKLYQCSLRKCPKSDDVYCKSCGNLSHLKIEGHSWKSSKRRIKFKAVDLSLVEAGYVKLDLMIRNKRFVGWKETGLQISSQVGGQVSAAAAAYSTLLYGGNAARVNVQLIDLVVDVTNGVQHGSKALYSGLAKATPWAIVAAATIDIAVHSYRFWKGDIEDWHEFSWYCGRSVSCAAASGLAGWGGAAGGAAIGTAMCPVVGTICGAIIGGLVSSILAGTLTSKGFERIWPNPNQKKRERIVREAISWFHFRHDDIFDAKTGKFNEKKFNKKLVMKQYRKLAKMYHPDRRDGDVRKWHEIQMHLGLLLALCEKNPSKKNEAVKCMKAIGI